MDREEDFTAAAQVLDIAIATMFWAAGYGPRALLAHFFFELGGCGASVDVLGLRWLRDDTFEFGGADEVGFAAIPLGEYLGGGSTAEDAGVDETRESEMRDVAGGAEDAFEVPDCFGANQQCDVSRCKGKGIDKGDLRVRVDLVKEASTVVLVKYPRKAPGLLLKWLYILDLYDQDISRFGPFYLKRARQVVNFGKIDVLHIVRAVIVANLSSCPIDTLHLEDLPIFDFGRKGNCRRRGQWL